MYRTRRKEHLPPKERTHDSTPASPVHRPRHRWPPRRLCARLAAAAPAAPARAAVWRAALRSAAVSAADGAALPAAASGRDGPRRDHRADVLRHARPHGFPDGAPGYLGLPGLPGGSPGAVTKRRNGALSGALSKPRLPAPARRTAGRVVLCRPSRATTSSRARCRLGRRLRPWARLPAASRWCC